MLSVMNPGSADEDPLADGPPQPSIPGASKSRGAKSSSSSAPGDISTLSSALIGGPTQIVMRDMMQLEKLIQEISKYIPEFQSIFAPAIDQGRSLVAAGLGNIAQGGMGALPQDTGAPAPAALGPSGAGAGAPPMPPGPMQ